MNVDVPFKWVLSSRKLKELNYLLQLKKYLCNLENENWFVQLEKRTIPRGRTVIIIQLIRNIWLKSFVVELDSRIEIFRAVPFTMLDSKRLIISENQMNAFSCLKPAVINEINLGNKLIIKGNFKFRISSREDLSNEKKSVSFSLPNEVHKSNSSQKFVEKQKATNDEFISMSKVEKTMNFQAIKLSKDLGVMYNNIAYSDVIITCQSQQFRAHKVILIARCPGLLYDSLQEDPLEMEAITKINIDDLPVLTVPTLLFYIYTGKLELTRYLACDLIFAAHKYNLQNLKDACVEYLVNNLNEENCLFIYSFSYSVDEILKQNALQYILQHFSSISNNTVWEQLKELRPDLTTDILSEIVKLKTPLVMDLTLE